MWLMKTLLTSGCTNQRGAGQYDRIRRTVVAHVFGERTLATLERLPGLLSAFEVVVWMTGRFMNHA